MKTLSSVKLLITTATVAILTGVAYIAAGYFYEAGDQKYIAHGGSAIDGYFVSNSLEAVENAINHGIEFIELDLQLTSDGKLVAAHDWQTFAVQTGENVSPENPPSYEEFKRSRIGGKYTPLTYELIDSVFSANPHLILVTDKITDVETVKKFLPGIEPGRVMMECFSKRQFFCCILGGFTPMQSYMSRLPGVLNVVGATSGRYQKLHHFPVPLAVYELTRISTRDADSLFAADKRIQYVYVDKLE